MAARPQFHTARTRTAEAFHFTNTTISTAREEEEEERRLRPTTTSRVAAET